MAVPLFSSDPALVTVTGWAKIGRLWWSEIPLRDPRGVSAHLNYKTALEAVARLGARLPTCEEIDELRDDALSPGGVLLDPVILPDKALLDAANIRRRNYPKGDAGDEQYRARVGAFLNANMGGEAWARYHEQQVQAQLAAKKWRPGQNRAVMNFGKYFAAGAPLRRAWLCGWWLLATKTERAHYIQAGHLPPGSAGPHGAEEVCDYATHTEAVSDEEPPGQTSVLTDPGACV